LREQRVAPRLRQQSPSGRLRRSWSGKQSTVFSLASWNEMGAGMINLHDGTQLFLAGFISELIGRNSTERNTYLIQSTANL
jgi:hypothetical protein